MEYSELNTNQLVAACGETAIPAAWEEFFRRFQPVIAATVIRTCRKWQQASVQLVDDLVQETFLKLCADNGRLLRDFKPTHEEAFYGYLKVLATNLVHDHFKGSTSLKRGAGRSNEQLPEERDELGSSQPFYKHSDTPADRNILIGQIDACLRGLQMAPTGVRDRQIFWLHFRSGLAASAIAQLPSIGLTTKGVESCLLRVTRYLRQELIERNLDSQSEKPAKGFRQPESL